MIVSYTICLVVNRGKKKANVVLLSKATKIIILCVGIIVLDNNVSGWKFSVLSDKCNTTVMMKLTSKAGT